MGFLLWIIAVALVIYGVITLINGSILFGIILIVVGLVLNFVPIGGSSRRVW